MRSSRFARLMLLFAALWLPLQAVAGMGMLLCRAGETAAQAAAMAEEHCPYHDAEPAPAQHQPAKCDHCGICHLAAAGYIPATELTAASVAAPQIYASRPAAQPRSHIPATPETPPKRSA